MAIGGALRAAIKAGNFVKVASESRRRARALAELNARGGIGRPGRARGADEYLRGRGVDVDAMTAPRTGNPYADWVEEDFGPIFSDSPFGGVNFFDRGRTMKFGGEGARYNLPMTLPTGSRYQGPIQAPYEGFRTFPQWGYNEPSSFTGRGKAPRFTQDAAYPEYDGDVFYEPFVFNPLSSNSFMNVPRAFGGNPGMAPRLLGSPALCRFSVVALRFRVQFEQLPFFLIGYNYALRLW
jgi:hypothetical protein